MPGSSRAAPRHPIYFNYYRHPTTQQNCCNYLPTRLRLCWAAPNICHLLICWVNLSGPASVCLLLAGQRSPEYFDGPLMCFGAFLVQHPVEHHCLDVQNVGCRPLAALDVMNAAIHALHIDLSLSRSHRSNSQHSWTYGSRGAQKVRSRLSMPVIPIADRWNR